ncbi:MAG: EAL domain-containing protein [Cyanobacteria bacterium J06626_6]
MAKQSNRWKSLFIIREAFTSLLPIVLVMNILVLASELTSLLEDWGLQGIAALNGDEINRLYFFLIPLFFNLSLSTLLAKEKGLEQVGTLLISMVCFFRVSGFLEISHEAELVSSNSSILTSLPCTWLAITLLKYFSGLPQSHLVAMQTEMSPRLRKTINLILPGLLTVLCFEGIGQVITLWRESPIVDMAIAALPHWNQLEAVPELILYKLVSLSTWFIGLHGEHSAQGLISLLNRVPIGEEASIQLKTFHNVFMNIGGSGSTFVLPFLIFFLGKRTQLQSIARLSLPFSFFNVNEVLLFGLPVLLNPIFLIPFLLAPFLNMAIALSAIHLGLFEISPSSIHWMSAPLYSAYIASNGSFLAVLTQGLCLVADGFVYMPFLILASQQRQAPLTLLKIFGEDAYTFVNEEIEQRQERLFFQQQQQMLEAMTLTQQVLQQLQGGRFMLYYQPKVDAKTLKLIGLEALLRFQNDQGKILPPKFLPVLYNQGLSQVVDTKVVALAFDQVIKWRQMGLAVPPIAINFDKDFLLDEQAVKAFILRAQRLNIQFYIEITEHTYTVELDSLASVVRQLRQAGHKVSIDDFGAGYSSLTTLLALEADEIKLDRQLVIAPETEEARGTILLATSIQLCHDLGFRVVAEGVENEVQLQQVQRCGADVIQGYYLGKPMHPDQMCDRFSKATEQPPTNVPTSPTSSVDPYPHQRHQSA